MPNAFVHIELNTDNVQAAKSFYQSLFKWKLQDNEMAPGMVYTMIDVGEGTGGGMQQKPMPEMPNMWFPYVEVDDVKATVAKARELGGRAEVEYMELPGGMGAFGVLVDPTGAALGVWAMPPRPAKTAARKPPKKKAAKKPPKKKAAKKPPKKRR